jgi:hypothetical protein
MSIASHQAQADAHRGRKSHSLQSNTISGPLTTFRQLADYRGHGLVNATVALVRRLWPVHVSIIGGEPLVRYRELCEVLPMLDRMGVEVQLVTSAVRAIPEGWNSIGPCTWWSR